MYPFERFSEDSKAVLILAQTEAGRAGQSFIGTEHLLFGLVRQEGGLAAMALKEMGLESQAIEAQIASIVQHQEPMPAIKQLIPTNRVKRVIEMAFDEAQRDHLSRVETGHLLLGVLLEGDGVAAHVLEDHGVTVERTRVEIDRLRSAGKVETLGAAPLTVRRHLSLTDQGGKPIVIDISFPADYPSAHQEALIARVRRAVESEGEQGSVH